MKNFNSYSELAILTTKTNLYVELPNGFFVKVSKSDLKKTADSMKESGFRLRGEILHQEGYVSQIRLNDKNNLL